MNPAVKDLWDRAWADLAAARLLVNDFPNAAASRAYYAAFNAVSAWFLLSGHIHKKHSGIQAAVHRDLVKAGIWSSDLGRDYSFLLDLRHTGDYGGGFHVTPQEARDAVDAAGRIIEAVRELAIEVFIHLN